MIGMNGKSYMEFDIKITKQRLEKGLDGMPQIEDIASWNIGAPGSLIMKTSSMALTQFSAVTIYRIVTVQVSDIYHYYQGYVRRWGIISLRSKPPL